MRGPSRDHKRKVHPLHTRGIIMRFPQQRVERIGPRSPERELLGLVVAEAALERAQPLAPRRRHHRRELTCAATSRAISEALVGRASRNSSEVRRIHDINMMSQ